MTHSDIPAGSRFCGLFMVTTADSLHRHRKTFLKQGFSWHYTHRVSQLYSHLCWFYNLCWLSIISLCLGIISHSLLILQIWLVMFVESLLPFIKPLYFFYHTFARVNESFTLTGLFTHYERVNPNIFAWIYLYVYSSGCLCPHLALDLCILEAQDCGFGKSQAMGSLCLQTLLNILAKND